MYNVTKDIYDDILFFEQTDVGMNKRASTFHVSYIMYRFVLQTPLEKCAHGADNNIFGEGCQKP
jgi:hypothetical protein